jgi:hypothetical protein
MNYACLVVLAIVLCAGCAGPKIALEKQREKTMILPPAYHQQAPAVAEKPAEAKPPATPPAQAETKEPAQPPEKSRAPDPRLATGLQNLKDFSSQLDGIEKNMQEWWNASGARNGKPFNTDETDRIEALLFQFLLRREQLWNMTLVYGDRDRNFAGAEDQTRAFALGYSAAVLQDYYSTRFVLDFMDESAAIRKINEIHHKYDIPADSFDSVFNAVTSPKDINAIRDAHKFFVEESRKTDSAFVRIIAGDPEYKALLEGAEKWYAASTASTDKILKKRSIILPDVANFLRQNKLMEEARKVTKHISDNLYVAQGLLFNNFGDIRQPMTEPADFNPDQVRLIKSLIQPGDLIFSFTAGYMSNVFLPGRFKHGITYIGTPEQRLSLGFTTDKIGGIPGPKLKKLEQDMKTAKLDTGYDADVIEAVAEGVIFNSLDYILKTHVNRMLVLRPRVSHDDRIQALGNTFLLLGSMYDFNFDFVDTSYQCCTEVIYRSYNKRGKIDFTLVPRAGVKTLAADDIVEYYLAAKEPVFDFIFLAEENPKSPIHGAVITTGDAGLQKLKDVMTEKMLKLPDLPLKLPFKLPGSEK